jgi:hypothetical protein
VLVTFDDIVNGTQAITLFKFVECQLLRMVDFVFFHPDTVSSVLFLPCLLEGLNKEEKHHKREREKRDENEFEK